MATELGRVFVVDDELEPMAALCDVLTRQGYKAAGFSSGEEALKALEEEEVDLLLSDIMMPGMSGIELLKAALKIDPNIIGIMMTGHGTIQTAVDAMKSGALDYVLKPFRPAELERFRKLTVGRGRAADFTISFQAKTLGTRSSCRTPKY